MSGDSKFTEIDETAIRLKLNEKIKRLVKEFGVPILEAERVVITEFSIQSNGIWTTEYLSNLLKIPPEKDTREDIIDYFKGINVKIINISDNSSSSDFKQRGRMVDSFGNIHYFFNKTTFVLEKEKCYLIANTGFSDDDNNEDDIIIIKAAIIREIPELIQVQGPDNSYNDVDSTCLIKKIENENIWLYNACLRLEIWGVKENQKFDNNQKNLLRNKIERYCSENNISILCYFEEIKRKLAEKNDQERKSRVKRYRGFFGYPDDDSCSYLYRDYFEKQRPEYHQDCSQWNEDWDD